VQFGYVVAGITALAAVSLASCGGGNTSEGESEFRRALPPDLRDADLTQLGSEEQLIPLTDGELSFSEYEKGFFALIACLEAEGLSFIGEPRIDSDGTTHHVVDGGSTDESLRHTQEIFSACRYQHFSILAAAWAWQTRLTESEVNLARALLSKCLRERDIDATDIPTDDELDRLMETYPDAVIGCSRKVEEETGLTGF
jgi:hypothetical protein